MKLAWLITILLATSCHCMYVYAAVIVENKQTNKQTQKHTQACWIVNNELKGSEIPAQFSSF